jgi:hypothetical protein
MLVVRLAAVAAALLAFGPVASAQVFTGIVTQWDFNSFGATPPDSTTNPTPFIGTGSASLLGGTTGATLLISNGTSSSDPGRNIPSNPNGVVNYAWLINNFPAQGTGSGTAGVQFSGINTTSSNNPFVSFDLFTQQAASGWYQVQYTTDGTTYQSLTGPLQVTSANPWLNLNSISLAGIAGVSSANFGIRIVSVFAPGTNTYAGVGGSYSPSGLNSAAVFDMVTVAQGNTWTSASSGNLQDGTKWSFGAPVSGAISSNLFFGPTTGGSATVTNNAGGFQIRTLSFAPGTTTQYTLGGQLLVLGSATSVAGLTTVVNASSQIQTIATQVQAAVNQTWDAGSAAGGGLVFSGTDLFLSAKTLTITGQNNTTLGAAITEFSGGSSITKTGSGTLNISANNPNWFGDATSGTALAVSVNQGVLRVTNQSGGSATGAGAVVVAPAGTLAGAQGVAAGTKGFITGNVTVNGAIQPGTTVTSTSGGQINFPGASQTVTFGTGSKYVWNLASLTTNLANAGIGYDQILVNNGAGLSLTGGVVQLSFSSATTPIRSNPFWQTAQSWTIVQVTGSPNTTQFSGIPSNPFLSVGTFSLAQGPNGTVVLTFTPVPVPEPRFVLAAGLAGIGLLGRFLRRFRLS